MGYSESVKILSVGVSDPPVQDIYRNALFSMKIIWISYYENYQWVLDNKKHQYEWLCKTK